MLSNESYTHSTEAAKRVDEPMKQISRFLEIDIQPDANRINATGRLPSMTALQTWYDNDVIHLDMAEVAQNEAAMGGNHARTEKAYSYIVSETLASTPEERRRLRDIESLLFPRGAKTRSQKNDVEVVFNAWKYKWILVTADGGSKRKPGGILGNAARLKQQLDVDVMTDRDAVEYVRERIARRDMEARERHENWGLHLPHWVGTD